MAIFEPVYAVMEVLVAGVGSDAVSCHWIRVIHPGGIRSSYSISPEYRSLKGNLWHQGSKLLLPTKAGAVKSASSTVSVGPAPVVSVGACSAPACSYIFEEASLHT